MSSWFPKPPRSIGSTVTTVLLWIEPDGGQAVARRNAWAALVHDRQRRYQRLAADRALVAALAGRDRAAVG